MLNEEKNYLNKKHIFIIKDYKKFLKRKNLLNFISEIIILNNYKF